MTADRWTPPPPEQARAAHQRGRDDALANRPNDRKAYTDRALLAMYRQGYAYARQEALQVRYGDPPARP